MQIFQILACIFLIPGFAMVFGANWFVGRFKLNEKATCDFENEMTHEELEKYKFNKAVVNFKMLGMLVALPGVILIIIAFR